jgi:dTDP-glucose 4,6-dehydratase
MSILVTGGAGFIGSHVVDLLLESTKEHIVVVDRMDRVASYKNIPQNHPRLTFVLGDYCSTYHMLDLLKRHQVHTIMHFAAYSHVCDSFENSIKFTENNVLGTHRLLEAVKTYGKLKLFIHVSTDEVYGGDAKANEVYESENTLLKPTNQYSATKAAAEMLVMSYYKSYGLPIIITRGNNVYGPRQHPEKLIPGTIQRCLRNEPLTIHGDGQQERSFLHVLDVAQAFYFIYMKGVVGQIYNIGTPEERTVMSVVQDIRAKCSDSTSQIVHVTDRPYNDKRYPIRSTQLEQLGWKQMIRWEYGLSNTVEWYREHPDWWS